MIAPNITNPFTVTGALPRGATAPPPRTSGPQAGTSGGGNQPEAGGFPIGQTVLLGTLNVNVRLTCRYITPNPCLAIDVSKPDIIPGASGSLFGGAGQPASGMLTGTFTLTDNIKGGSRNFNSTVVFDLAPDATAGNTQVSVSTGSATIQGNQIIWNNFSLSSGAQASATISMVASGAPVVRSVSIDAVDSGSGGRIAISATPANSGSVAAAPGGSTAAGAPVAAAPGAPAPAVAAGPATAPSAAAPAIPAAPGAPAVAGAPPNQGAAAPLSAAGPPAAPIPGAAPGAVGTAGAPAAAGAAPVAGPPGLPRTGDSAPDSLPRWIVLGGVICLAAGAWLLRLRRRRQPQR